MKAIPMCQWILEISLALCFLAVDCKGLATSLDVEKGDSLVNPHCPGTVRLVCEAVNLTFLEWSYNDQQRIHRFASHKSNTTIILLNGAFVSVQLTEPPQCITQHCVVANFSSVLTVDMLQLQQQNISSISCGALDDDITIAVNVTVLQPFSLKGLNIRDVTAYYSEGVLNIVEVYWDKLLVQYQNQTGQQIHNINCSEYESSIVYNITVSGSEPVQINHTSCGETMCTAVLTNFSTSLTEYNLTLTVNEVMSSEAPFSTIIDFHSDQYFRTGVNTTSCQISAQCVLNDGHSGQCTIQYTTDPTYTLLSDPPAIPENSASILSTLTPNTTYWFEFSLVIQEGFVVKERHNLTTTEPRDVSIGSNEIAVLGLAVLFILSVVVHCIAVPVILLKVSMIRTSTSKKRLLLMSTLLLLLLVLVCVGLLTLTVTGIIEGNCTSLGIFVQQQGILNALLVISCLGTTFTVIIWLSVGYSVCQNRGSPKVRPRIERVNHRYEQQDPPQAPNSNRYDIYGNADVIFQDEIEKSGIENEMYEHIHFEEQMGDYDILEHSTRNSMLQQDAANLPRDETYSMIEDPVSTEPCHGNAYEHLRPGEKSRPVPNLLDPNYSHVGKRKPEPEPDLPDILHSFRAENMRDDYDVLDRELGRASFVSVQSAGVNNSFYDTLDEDATELRGRRTGVYNQLRPGEKSRPVPNMDDLNYSHVHVEKEQSEPSQRMKPKMRVFRKIK